MTMTTAAPASGRLAPAQTRIGSVDILRGVVMVLMAIDHVRVYSGVPAGGPDPGVFLTRWITHFCAPAFVFFAGTSAFLYGRKLLRDGMPSDLMAGTVARYLAIRGLILVVLEFTVIRASWTFHFDYSSFLLAGVIWMLGCCMILLAALVWLPIRALAAIALGLILFQQVFAAIGSALPPFLQPVWEFIYPIGAEVILGANGPTVAVLYSIVPWIGVMAAGYAFGAILVRPAVERDRLCLRIGLTATGLFLLVGGAAVLLDAPNEAPALLRLLNQSKYPASQLFLMMTLGPAIALIPLAERATGRIAAVFSVFGRVPMFYYLLHIPLIHATALVVWLLRDGTAGTDRFATAPYVSMPPPERWSLPLLYLVFAIVVALLYPACRWYAAIKARRSQGWLRYL
ncbi:MAG TPA: heparan-alpha-glucosaminide N-acetyltransferase domain-containing protein [Vicinamibacterales bacterium]|nr:heparan-alpha-glucosaminide N-acetyltransferase domain-containing protein [Vicinamibacterales bacterium]